ncbi:response regulator transcription factor [Aneurinibacillus aneurinilyticus]|jgi:two-component system response regulator CssR|uniref:Response regulator transcription factor n=2 Tax=Aneurinibacillus aneurinilyticus TaxID=1391 RepID=A0A848D0K0_ANEAE|nr:response regulator transcription factor [Aneurinibacillus aneurinilyticus]ERI07605.1 transcriptional regulatory protein CssR [Aneurinibacillus aneurinilyticus ATCC 12856]MCI1692708.1 response regulator transcription factor [Aneurinibacillus aneurinilyticus]MED0670255.1 response regulator transcription factor [Aneurinibacillus aneurinilyticus]MED0707240.1 response regulator transcription factor [Aneurinibacillus aneurinilyticus]MED0722023.1 response regulator transcription factor [Aneuriniba
MTYHVYLVEDEVNLNRLLTSYLQNEGWHVTSFTTGTEAKAAIPQKPHVWILDIMLPDTDGFELLSQIKNECADTPIIFISARDADLDRVLGLEMGSDDYLAKPFLPRELVIRTKKLLERIYGKTSSASTLPISDTLSICSYTVWEKERRVYHGEQPIELTSKELDLLLLFAKHPGQALSRQQILSRIWGTDYFGTDRAVDDLVRRLRKKMPELHLETLYGYGYRMTSA